MPKESEVYEKGNLRRLVVLVESFSVEYALYRRQEIWRQHEPNRVEWWLYHHYVTAHKNWDRWEKGATLVK